jgi:hypothetical protein
MAEIQDELLAVIDPKSENGFFLFNIRLGTRKYVVPRTSKIIFQTTPLPEKTESAESAESAESPKKEEYDIVVYINCHGAILPKPEQLPPGTNISIGDDPKAVICMELPPDLTPTIMSAAPVGRGNYQTSIVEFVTVGNYVIQNFPMNMSKLLELRKILTDVVKKMTSKQRSELRELHGSEASLYLGEEGYYIGKDKTKIIDRHYTIETNEKEGEEEYDGIFILEDQKGTLTGKTGQNNSPTYIFDMIKAKFGYVTRSGLLLLLHEYGYKNPLIVDTSCAVCEIDFKLSPSDLKYLTLHAKRHGFIGGKSKRKFKKNKSKFKKTKRKSKK